jgi:hypothetical protein
VQKTKPTRGRVQVETLHTPRLVELAPRDPAPGVTLARGPARSRGVITARRPLAEINDAMADLRAGCGARTMLAI